MSSLIPANAVEWVIGNGNYNKVGIRSVLITNHTTLKRIVIGEICFGNVRVFELDGLSELESVVIGKRSLSLNPADPWDSERTNSACRIVNCPKLKSIQIGDCSFSDYHSFELSNLPSLQSVEIGWKCFYYTASFSLTGMID